MKKLLLSITLISGFLIVLFGQGSGVPLGSDTYHIMDRLSIKSGKSAPFHNALKYYSRGEVVRYAIDIDTSFQQKTPGDQWDLQYIFKDNNEWLVPGGGPTTLTGKQQYVYKKKYVDSTETFYTIEEVPLAASKESNRYYQTKKPLLKYFYKTPANLFEFDHPSFSLKINPILNLKMGNAKNDDEPIFRNQRGIEVRGAIDNRVYFYSNILESQARFANYVTERIISDKAIPGQGLYKNYNSSVFDITNGYDFLNAQGYIGFNVTKHIGLQFGHGRNFIGNGYRSMILSDYANNYLYLKLNTKFWKLHYQNIFAELSPLSAIENSGNNILPKKFIAAHHLSIDILPTLNIGIFESVVFSRNQFEFQYLNPIILYRTVEHLLDSPDNVLIGIDGKWNLFKRFQLYGQLMLDEFKLNELLVERNGWWANKYGLQVGLKYIDVLGIDHLDAQVEYNSVRPFTYTHRDSSASYSHFNQPLAHPLGANFKETIFRLRYQPIPKLVFEGRLISAKAGGDTRTENWGTNILTPHGTRVQDFGNEIGQGISANILLAGLDVSYQLFHNGYLDLHFFYRDKDSVDDELDLRTTYFGGGFRMNISNQKLDF